MKIRMLTAIAASALCLTAFSSAEAGGRKGDGRGHHGGGGHECKNDNCGGGHHGGKHHGGKHHGGKHHNDRYGRDNDDRKDFLGPAYGLGFTFYGTPGATYGYYNAAQDMRAYCLARPASAACRAPY